ncbi:MAG: lysylphosphatidylglycerol synthase transmembrane domain-containing protein [Thermomicrobiales bacterium]
MASTPAVTVQDTGEDTEDQAPDNLGKRFMQPRTLISFGLALVILVFVFSRLNIDPSLVWSRVKQANVGLLLAAGVVYYASLFVRGLRWKMMLGRVGIDEAHGYPMPGPVGMFHIIFLSWFANCVVPARLGDAYRSYLLKQKNKASFGTTFGTILAERLIDLVTLIMVLLTAGIVVFGTRVPHRAEQAFLIGAAVVIVGVIGVIVLWFGRDHFERLVPERFTLHYRRLSEGIFEILKRPIPYGVIGAALWMFDGTRVLLVAWALNAHLTIAEATVVALLSALATAIPLTPGGAGTVEAFMIIMLPWVGIKGDAAAALALLDRVVTYWSLIAIGLPVYIISLRHAVPIKPGETKTPPLTPRLDKKPTSFSAISQTADSDV